MMFEKYTIVQTIGDSHKVYLVKNIQDNSFYVKKILDIYDRRVYEWLLKRNISGVPIIKEIYEENNNLVVIEEYLSGRTLETMLERHGHFKDSEVEQIIIKLCTILKNITDLVPFVHRDIKPSNIIIKDNGELYLIDFNAAKISEEVKSRDTVLLGTEGYAAPEQYGFASSNLQTDIYAIGVLMKELLTGSIDLNEEYHSKLKPIIKKCTMMDPNKRYLDYDSLIKQLKYHQPIFKNKYLPIGFRSGKPSLMILASLWYAIIILLSKSLTVEGSTGINLAINQVGFGISLLAVTFFSGNYLDCQDRTFLRKIKNQFFKLIVILFIDGLIFTLILMLGLIIGSIF